MFNILIAGVGGQGNVLASRVIAECAIKKGLHVKTAETIGMAQREGTVVSHLRIGKIVNSSLVSEGKGDLLIGMEIAEGARSLSKLNKDAKIIINDYSIVPAMVSIGMGTYQEKEIKDYLKKYFPKTLFIRASSLALEIGTLKVTNVIMLGSSVQSGFLPFSSDEIWFALKELLPEKLHAINKKAFQSGIEAVKAI